MTPRFIFSVFLFSPYLLIAQFQLKWNLEVDTELSKAGDFSHYYYNEIHRAYTDWKLDLARVNLLTNLAWSEKWEINIHALLEREHGKKAGFFKDIDDYDAHLLSLNIVKKFLKKPLSITLGRFNNPFGAFYAKPFYKDMTFLAAPLAYNHYTNVSQYYGLVEGLGEPTRIRIEGEPEWGTPTLYRLGYKTGVRLDWGLPGKTSGTVAFVSGASNKTLQFSKPFNWGLISKIQFQPSYFARLGFSISHGSFSANAASLDTLGYEKGFYQSLLGMDYNIGLGFFEFSGELIGAHYKVPQYLAREYRFRSINQQIQKQNLQSLTGYFDVKYEPPFFPGSFLAYRFDFLGFGSFQNVNAENAKWDSPLSRHSLAIGHKINRYTQIKTTLSTQQVANRDWDNQQRVFRCMLIFHW